MTGAAQEPVAYACDVAVPSPGRKLMLLEYLFSGTITEWPVKITFKLCSEPSREERPYLPVREGLSGRVNGLLQKAYRPFRVRRHPFFLRPGGRRQEYVGEGGGLSVVGV